MVQYHPQLTAVFESLIKKIHDSFGILPHADNAGKVGALKTYGIGKQHICFSHTVRGALRCDEITACYVEKSTYML